MATGGCFDLLHAGHARTLAAAAKPGDCLIVCLNSDASVRRLKGPDRPILNQADRKELLQSLGAVDAVVVFEEDTPEACLDQLRPDIWVKGGDYESRQPAGGGPGGKLGRPLRHRPLPPRPLHDRTRPLPGASQLTSRSMSRGHSLPPIRERKRS